MNWQGMENLLGREEVRTGFWWGNVRERDNLQGLGVDVNTILKLIFKIWDVGMEWIYLAQDRGRWWALVSAVKSLWVPKCVEDFLAS